MNGCSTLPFMREMQIKTSMEYHLMPVSMAIITTKLSVGEDVKTFLPLHSVGGNVNCYNFYEKQNSTVFLKKLKMEPTYNLAIQFLGSYPKITGIRI